MYPSGLKSLSRVNLFHWPLISLQQQSDAQRRRTLSAASYHGNTTDSTVYNCTEWDFYITWVEKTQNNIIQVMYVCEYM